jgi:hypothetical protein
MEKNYVIAAQAATLDKMDLTPDELLFALREFDAIWQRFEQTDPIQRGVCHANPCLRADLLEVRQ